MNYGVTVNVIPATLQCLIKQFSKCSSVNNSNSQQRITSLCHDGAFESCFTAVAVPRCVVTETLNWKNVVLVLGRRLPLDKSQCSEFVCWRTHTFSGRPPPPRCAAAWTRVCPLADEESVLMVWNSTMPMEVKDLRRHCEKREQIAAKMREQLHHDWSCAFLFPFFHLQYFYFPMLKLSKGSVCNRILCLLGLSLLDINIRYRFDISILDIENRILDFI